MYLLKKKNMIKIGLTGGIGSGKTTVAKLFEKLDIPVYYADDKAKYLMANDPKIKKKLIEIFGPETFKKEQLNTKYLADIVFKHPSQLKKLEKIVHPAVRKDFISWSKKQNAPYIIVENAILHKSGMDELVDYIIVVTGNKEKRIQRLISRDKIDKNEIENRIRNQENDDFLTNNADFIITNNKNIDFLDKKVKFIDQKLKKLLR
jgi:dephospho-CoA kinase